jgi:hypothetical protein
MKKTTIIFLILFIAFNLTLTTEAKTNKIKIKATEQKTTEQKTKIKFNNNSFVIQKDFNGAKLTVKTPKISKNKYLRLVNMEF